jgi:hypothetical protein
MKKLLLVFTLAIPALVKSQDTIHIPYSVAKTVAKELVECDSTKAILQLTKEQLVLTEQKVVLKDSIIATHEHKGIMYESIIVNQDQKFGLQGKWVTELEKKNRVLRAKLTFMQIVTTIFMGIMAYIYVAK